MRLGILLPHRGVILQSARRPPVEDCWTIARLCDAADMDVWVGDSVVAKPRLEPLTTLAYVAAMTQRARLGTAILLPALRQPTVLAHQLANLDQISQGRVVLGLGVGATSGLTAVAALGSLLAFGLSARVMNQRIGACGLGGLGAVIGLVAFALVIFSAPLQSVALFKTGVLLVGFGSGLFSVGMLVNAMTYGDGRLSGLALGAWGAVQATSAGVAMALGGLLRDGVDALAQSGRLGEVLQSPVTGYSFVYHLEMYMLLTVLIALGPMARRGMNRMPSSSTRFGLAELPS